MHNVTYPLTYDNEEWVDSDENNSNNNSCENSSLPSPADVHSTEELPTVASNIVDNSANQYFQAAAQYYGSYYYNTGPQMYLNSRKPNVEL